MKQRVSIGAFVGLVLAFAGTPRPAWTHCDTTGGPVIRDAEVALATGDITPVLKWVRADDEAEIREVFAQALQVRTQGETAKALADRLFFETLVRVHRAGEGAPFTGLKPAGELEPGIAEADKALETGSVDGLARTLSAAVEEGVRRRFARAVETRHHAGEDVAQGRAFVAAYVDFVHHVERLEAAAAPAGEAEQAAHAH
jgi:Family of unknown function (DUF6448)